VFCPFVRRLPVFTEEEKALLAGSADFLGINYYFSSLISQGMRKVTKGMEKMEGRKFALPSFRCCCYYHYDYLLLKVLPAQTTLHRITAT